MALTVGNPMLMLSSEEPLGIGPRMVVLQFYAQLNDDLNLRGN